VRRANRAPIFVRLVGALSLLGMGCGSPAAATQSDAGHDAPVPFDAGDGAPPTGDRIPPSTDAGQAPPPIACPPNPEHFVPPTYVPAVGHQGLCSPAEVADFITQCVDPGLSFVAWSDANVAGWTAGSSGTPCGNCIFPPRNENNGAMWIDPDGLFRPNYGGCMQLLDPVHGPACAAAVNAVTACQAFTCEYCPGYGPHDDADCEAAAMATCGPYLTASQNACAMDTAPGGPFDMCAPTGGGTEDYAVVVNLICGASPVDGGAPDGT
jgi:hypothetical protein